MANIQEYKEALYHALNSRLEIYEDRLRANPRREQKHVTLTDIGKYSTAVAVVGTAIGTAVPGIGNAIGAAAGTVVGVLTAGCIEIDYRRENKKINNAGKIQDYLRENARDVLRTIADRVIDERADFIKGLQDTPENKRYLTEYLAVNIMAAIKHDGGHTKTPLLDIAVNGLRDPRSDKKRSRTLKNADDSSVTLAQIARYQFFRPPAASAPGMRVLPAVGGTPPSEIQKEKPSLLKRNTV